MEYTLLSVIGGIIALALLIFRAIDDKNRKKKEEKDVIDKEIDSATNANDFIKLFRKLRNK